MDYDSFVAGGLHIYGNLWGRENDDIGVELAYLNGGNKAIISTQVAEAYYRFVLTNQIAFTADLKFMKDDKTSGKDPAGIIIGLRIDTYCN